MAKKKSAGTRKGMQHPAFKAQQQAKAKTGKGSKPAARPLPAFLRTKKSGRSR
jgi:hypothetical protein